MTRLRDHNWQESFTSSQDNLLDGFYRPALQESIRYWRITGYFSSRSLLQVLDGVEQLVKSSPDGRGHGQMRLITGFFMSRAALQALGSEQKPEQLLEQQLRRQFPFRDVQPGDGSAADLGAELLAWLVHRGIDAMAREEAAYWLGMAMHRKNPRRALAALRLLLSAS